MINISFAHYNDYIFQRFTQLYCKLMQVNKYSVEQKITKKTCHLELLEALDGMVFNQLRLTAIASKHSELQINTVIFPKRKS